jgi:hypothetical protein
VFSLAATAAVMALVVAASSAPVAFHASESGRLRLSWSARPERIEKCRQVSAEELAEREEHMRQRVECEGHFASYTLAVAVDGQPLDTSIVRGAGLRHDRPIYLLRTFDMAAGRRHVRVEFRRREQSGTARTDAEEGGAGAGVDTVLSTGRAQREMVERARRGKAAIPPRLVLDTVLNIAPREVIVLTFNQERRELEVLQGEP